jgi:hypothetical protein
MHLILQQQQAIIEEIQQSHITVQEMNEAIAALKKEMLAYTQ